MRGGVQIKDRGRADQTIKQSLDIDWDSHTFVETPTHGAVRGGPTPTRCTMMGT
jgi:hypothetical protein